MGAKIDWDDKASGLLAELWQTQLTLTEIAHRMPMQISLDAVRAHAIRLSLGPRPKRARRPREWTEEQDGRIRSMLAGGHSRPEIAEAVGKTVGAVNHRLREVAADILENTKKEEQEIPEAKPNPMLAKIWLRAMINVARKSTVK